MKADWRRAVLYLAVIGIEGCWLYALLALLNRQTAGGGLSVFGILLLYPVSLALNRLARRAGWPAALRNTASGAAWVAATLLLTKAQLFGGLPWADTAWLLAAPRAIAAVIYTFSPALLLLLGAAAAWWLGQRLASLNISFTTLLSEFQFGLVLLLLTFFAARQLGADLAGSVYLIVAFFLFSLLGISVAHALEGTHWLAGRHRGQWLGLMLVSVSLVLVLGFIISAIVSHDLLQLLLAALRWVWGLVVQAIAYLLSLLPQPDAGELPPLPPMEPPPLPPADETPLFALPEALRDGLRVAWTVMVAGFALFALWRVSSDIFRWLRRRLSGTAGAEFEPLPGAFRADLLGMLRRLLAGLLALGRLFRPRRAAPALPETASVRQIYRQFLRWAGAAGFPRHTSQTPLEYQQEMTNRLPEAAGDLDVITRQYVRTRYGAGVPAEDEIQQLRQSWYNVKHHRPGRRHA